MMIVGIELQRLGDLDQLPLARRQALDRRIGAEIELDFAQQRRRSARAGARRSMRPPLPRGMSPMKMFSAIVRLEKRLSSWWMKAMPRRSASRASRRRIGRAVERHGAGVGRDDAADDVHQRRFAGAVLADEPEDAAAAERERHVGEHRDAEEALADTARTTRTASLMFASLATSRVRRTSSSAAARMIAPFTTSMWKAESRM